MRINKYFRLEEYLDKKTFQTRGWAGSTLLCPRMLYANYEIREYLGDGYLMVINDWLWKEEDFFEYRAYRPLDYRYGAEYSQHRFGRASDFDIYKSGTRIAPKDVQEIILDLKKKGSLSAISAMEVGENWTHIDCRFSRNPSKIMIFRKK